MFNIENTTVNDAVNNSIIIIDSYPSGGGGSGPQGSQGPQGNIGVQGSQGPQGNIGVQGTQGSQGNVGAQGAQGSLSNLDATAYGQHPIWNSYTNSWQLVFPNTNVALGYNAGLTGQKTNAIAIGNLAGQNTQGNSAIAIGNSAGLTGQGNNALAIGNLAGQNNQGNNSVSIGYNAGQNTQGISSIAIGNLAGINIQGEGSIAIGNQAGYSNQGFSSIAIGELAGFNNQTENTVAIGTSAGGSYQNPNAISIGNESGQYTQGTNAIAIGYQTGKFIQHQNAIAIGNNAGQSTQGTNAIAIGYQAGYTDQHNNSIIINADSTLLNSITPSSTYISPIRSVSPNPSSQLLSYDVTNKEVVYGTKTFVIDHPLDKDKYLVHACLEGPESGVYYRGKGEIKDKYTIITLPNYANNFTDWTVQVSCIYENKFINIAFTEVENNEFKVYSTEPCKFHWTVYGKRNSIEVEPYKNKTEVKGTGPYKWIS